MVCFRVDYLGKTVVDKRFSTPMVPWVIADVQRRKKVVKIKLAIEDKEIKGINENESVLFRHDVQQLSRFCHEPSNVRLFLYLIREDSDPLLHCYLYEAPEFEDVVEIFQTMKESARDYGNWQTPSKSHSSAASLTSLCPDISLSNSMFFEVLYVGKIKVSHRNVPDTFIDDALEKIRLQVSEIERAKKRDNGYCKTSSLDANRGLEGEGDKPGAAPDEGQGDKTVRDKPKKLKSSFSHDDIHAKIGLERVERILQSKGMGRGAINGVTNESGSTEPKGDDRRANLELGYQRARAGSLSVIDTFRRRTDVSNHNRTMLFHIGRTDLRLISPDRKQVLLHEKLRDIVGCVQGLKAREHFGFICREVDSYVGYIFKCDCEAVAENIVSVIAQSFQSMKESKDMKQPILSCEHCPMVWFHKLCAEIEGLNDRKIQVAILKRIETLPAEEQKIIHAKYLGTESSNVREQNEFLMILLRTHCETKQGRHVHDTAENRSEFLQQYLGGSTIFMKAKRSLTSSFDQLLKRRVSQLDTVLQQAHSKESLGSKSNGSSSETDSADGGSRSWNGENGRKDTMRNGHVEGDHSKAQTRGERSDGSQRSKPSFPDIAALTVNNQKIEKAMQQAGEESDGRKTPMLNIFLKVGSTASSPTGSEKSPAAVEAVPDGSWRQAIFNRVVSPSKANAVDGSPRRSRTRQELRDLWRKAIHQQLLLIRMEKENARLKERQEEATVKRIKLEYDELASLSKEYMGIWELISNKDSRLISSKCDDQMMLQAIRQGVPPAKRGDVWHFLAVQYCLKQPPFDSTAFPSYDVPYEDLLKQLTSFQHAILIDLGRTFPNHPYFSSPLGPGQLALFNLLKAYSLLDPQVGYCQGLSFIAGVLLLHMSEEAAFQLLRHLMFRRGIRRQYLPDMAALQVQLYQLTRLLYDTLPRLYAHFDRNEVAPTLYAAPWMLTLFASQFPLGFVTRVFDLIFLEHTTDIIFRVILALLEEHMESLLSCSTFEEIMSYLKNDIPKMIGIQVEKIMKRVLTMDISKRLHEYEVEYHVLQEEMSTPRPKLEELKKLELENKRLTDQNLALLKQLEIVNENSNRLEKSRSTQQSVINRLENQIRNLEITIATLGDFISDACEQYEGMEVPGDVRRIISGLECSDSGKHVRFNGSHRRASKGERSGTPKNGLAEEVEEGEEGLVDESDGRERAKGGDEDDSDRKPANGNNLTTKITAGVSSLFAPSQGQTRNNKTKTFLPHVEGNGHAHGDNHHGKGFASDGGLRKEVAATARKDRGKRDGKPPRSAADSSVSGNLMASNETSVRFHPLDSCHDDVNITYNGTMKLKSIKSGAKPLNRSNATIYCE